VERPQAATRPSGRSGSPGSAVEDERPWRGRLSGRVV